MAYKLGPEKPFEPKKPSVTIETLREQPPEFVADAENSYACHALSQRSARLREWFFNNWPMRYRSMMDDRLDLETVEKALCWDWTHGKNLILIGPTGSGKTWLAWQVVKKHVCDLGVKTESALESQLSISIGDKAMSGSLSAYLEELCTPTLLFVDDLGKAPPTERYLASLYHISERRYAHSKPTILTTQYGEDELLAKWSSRGDANTAHAIARRLAEGASTIKVDSSTNL